MATAFRHTAKSHGLDLRLSRGKSPIYRQIAEQLKTMIGDGRLPPGSTLPTIRQLASELGVSNLTVFNAYGELKDRGLVSSLVGKGTVVTQRLPYSAGAAFLSRAPEIGPIPIYEEVSDSIGLRSMASAVPDPALFHPDELIAEIETLRFTSPWTFYYCEPAGVTQLRVQIAEMLGAQGLPTSENQLVVTYGHTHALSLVLPCVAEPGDAVCVVSPGFLGLKNLLAHLGLSEVRVDRQGDEIDVDQLVRAVRSFGVKAIYLAPTGCNGTGLVMSAECRMRFAEAVRTLDVLVIEDGSYSQLIYDGVAPSPIAATLEEQTAYVGSFSNCLSPGLRMGYVRAPASLRSAIVARNQALGISGQQFLQIALARFIENGRLQSHLARVLPKYKGRRAAMLESLQLRMPKGVKWTYPAAGFSTWVTLPPGGDYSSLYSDAIEQGVAFAPGSLFSVGRGAERQLRLSFGLQSVEGLQEAVQIFARLIEDRLER